ncbi:recombination protein MgsA [Zymomonas mobilis]|uniref:replication-associated recombination protein A n=1 Tax=Zymomonas mobilis TaxID=542 RepID=UPI00026D8101|nr:replication-associated recombination protein A [Zymomonas mobilis]AFN56970.1 AAA ATPase central domain protein [Zymomonas mobilis subsp. mobilis ATCC 29191]TQK77593.1 recombination protein MgsA [Zymomonas mobilis]TQL15756.1 recombination protein MgsA [Zymomonas mobilis]GEB88260.1 ATPase AAA [Zymomonas mobilis subsp. mobilis]
MDDLFNSVEPLVFTENEKQPLPGNRPLADILRPKHLSDVIGQAHVTGENGIIGRMVAAGRLSSLILWGPPGTGKTSIAQLLAESVGMRFEMVSAIFSGVADLKKIFQNAATYREMGKQTLLFIDEIHRFNKGQQDSFLPYIENGTFVLVGATTENPSFALNAALLSRAQVVTLNRLDEEALGLLLERAETVSGQLLPVDEDARKALIASADGDGRFLLNQAEILLAMNLTKSLSVPELAQILQKRMAIYDKDRDGHYNLISALHKSVRGSDPQAALYYLSRMLVAGEDPLYLLRRLTRMANEEVGLADPRAMEQCIAAKETYQLLGSPEGELAIAQACVYVATAPKSNAIYKAYNQAMALARESGSVLPPPNILNAPTEMMKQQGYGEGYHYDHDMPDAFSGDNYWPENLPPVTLYQPNIRGYEKHITERLAFWAHLRQERKKGKPSGK